MNVYDREKCLVLEASNSTQRKCTYRCRAFIMNRDGSSSVSRMQGGENIDEFIDQDSLFSAFDTHIYLIKTKKSVLKLLKALREKYFVIFLDATDYANKKNLTVPDYQLISGVFYITKDKYDRQKLIDKSDAILLERGVSLEKNRRTM